MLAATMDVTERKGTDDILGKAGSEFALESARVGDWKLDRTRLIIDTIPTMTWSVRPDGTVDFINQRWLDYTGLTFEQYIDEPTGPMHPEDIPRVLKKWLAVMAAGEPYEDEMRLRRADGEYRWFLVRTVPLRDEGGNIVKWFGCSVDIEDRKRAEQRLHALVGRLNSVREDEAKRIARELHDDLGQKLTALNMELADLEINLVDATPGQRAQIDRMHSVVDHTIEVVQAISSELRLGQLDVLGLTAAIEWQLKEFSRRSAIPCTVTRLDEIMNLSDSQNTAIFRILQEALTNILRHAGATRVDVSLQTEPSQLTLRVHDNGRGIAAAELNDRKAIGLLGMRERAQSVGGGVTITGGADIGTTVLVTIPLEPAGKISL
jgi:PAS domain S-box-containing protein